MPFRLPPAFHSSTDTSRHWLWLALVTGLLALLLAGWAMAQSGGPGTKPNSRGLHPAGADVAPVTGSHLSTHSTCTFFITPVRLLVQLEYRSACTACVARNGNNAKRF